MLTFDDDVVTPPQPAARLLARVVPWLPLSTGLKIEDLTAATMTTRFAGPIAERRVVWRTLNVDEPENNRYKNPFGTEIASFRTSEGGMARMAVSWDTPGFSGEMGRIRGQKGTYYGKYEGLETKLPAIKRPPLPPGVEAGGHGGSHGQLMNEFVLSILADRKPLVDIAQALNMTVAGIVAHTSALKDGETLKIPQYTWA